MDLIRMVILHHLQDMNDLPAQERWMWRYHAPEVLRNAPWTTHYLNYRVAPPPPGAEAFGYYNYQVHEVVSELHANGGYAFTREAAPMDTALCFVPDRPTDDFLPCRFTFDEKTVFRWVVLFKYPEGVSIEEGERWFLDVHAKEVLQQPGLIRFFSYRTLPIEFPGSPSGMSFGHPKSRASMTWDRACELWYESGADWAKAVIEQPPRYTKPAWATSDSYPFFKPGTDFVSTFILERPTDDYLRDLRPLGV